MEIPHPKSSYLANFVALSQFLILARAFAVDPTNFFDGFEGPVLDPFWSRLESAGSITFPSSAQAHLGLQSVQFNSVNGAGQKNIELRHTFDAPQWGTVSVWVFDTGADVTSGNYLGLRISNSALGSGATLFTQDFDLGPANGGHYYYSIFDTLNSEGATTAVDRTQAWHQWTISAAPGVTTMAVDGQTVYTGPISHPFDFVAIDIHGPSFRPSFVAYYDDFAFAAPEPSTCGLILTAAFFAGVARRRRVGR